MDLFWFEKINNLAGRWPILDGLGIFLSGRFSYVFVLIVLAFAVKEKIWRRRKELINLIASPILSRLIIAETIRLFWLRPRPPIILTGARQLIEIGANEKLNSFPSGHATFFFALATAVYFSNKKLGLALLFGTGLIGLARIFVGVHWPSDILGGVAIGVGSAIFINYLTDKIIKHD